MTRTEARPCTKTLMRRRTGKSWETLCGMRMACCKMPGNKLSPRKLPVSLLQDEVIMKTPIRIFAVIVSGLLISVGSAVAKTASCPCSPCKCSPCTCGGSKGPSKGGGGKHHDKEHGHDHHDGSSVGVGVNVDLGGVGHRTREGDHFASGGGEKPVAHTEEKHSTT